jgi:micrococcal nuclease
MKWTRNNRRLVKAVLVLLATIGSSISLYLNKPWTTNNEFVKVVKVKDGDTVVVETQKGHKELRIWGIDAPEWGQPKSLEAKNKLKELVLNKHVRVRHPKTDDFNRDLAFITIEDTESHSDGVKSSEGAPKEIDVGSILISQGLAWCFSPDPEHKQGYETLEAKARNLGLGIWSMPNPKKPVDFRRENKNKLPKTFKLN